MVSLYRNYVPSALWMAVPREGVFTLTMPACTLLDGVLRNRLHTKLKL